MQFSDRIIAIRKTKVKSEASYSEMLKVRPRMSAVEHFKHKPYDLGGEYEQQTEKEAKGEVGLGK